MKRAVCRAWLVLLSASLICAGALPAQQSQTGGQLAPASSTPQTSVAPNLRNDSKPHAGQAGPSDSPSPAAELPNMEATPMDVGLDWSVSQDPNHDGVTRRIRVHKGRVEVLEIQTRAAVALPVTQPPEPASRVITDVPEPPVKQMPPPQDPLAGIPQ